MYLIVLRVVLPFLQKYLVDAVASYLHERRIRRLEATANNIPSSVEAVEEVVVDEKKGGISASTIWFTLSGILLGSAFGLILYVLMRDSNNRL